MKKIIFLLLIAITLLIIFIFIVTSKPIYRCYDFDNNGEISIEEVNKLKEVVNKCGNEICEPVEADKRFPCPLDCEYKQ